MANEKRLILTAQEAIAKAEQELSTSRYIAECTRSPGMRAIHDKRCQWLSVIVDLAKKATNGDAVEGVRCKDCKSWEKGNVKTSFPDCGTCWKCMLKTHQDHFCSYGERREGE